MIVTPSTEPLDDAAHLRAKPAASWGAILAGAVVAVSLSLILLTLGAGLGFATISPWPNHGVSAASMTLSGTIWLIVTQWLSAAAGGYVAGRLRHRWLATHTHEVFFRDTAHGLITWGVATLFVVAVLASSMTSALGGGARAAGAVAAAEGHGLVSHGDMQSKAIASPDDLGSYNLDKLFRPAAADTAADSRLADRQLGDARNEVMHISANAALSGGVSEEDRVYMGNLVARKTGASAEEAQKRVDAFIQSNREAIDKAKAVADEARKAAAKAALLGALALLIGAFIASVSGAIGGRLRDEHL